MDGQRQESRGRERRALGGELCACSAPEGAPRARGDESGQGSWEQPRLSGWRAVSGSWRGAGLGARRPGRSSSAARSPLSPPPPGPPTAAGGSRGSAWRPVAQLPSPLPARSPQGASHGFLGFSGPECSQKGASWAGHLLPQRCLRSPEAAPPRRRLMGAHASRTARLILAGTFSPPSWAPRTPPPKLRGQGPLLPRRGQRGGRGRGPLCLPSASLLLPPRAARVPPKNRTTPTAFRAPRGSSGVPRGR